MANLTRGFERHDVDGGAKFTVNVRLAEVMQSEIDLNSTVDEDADMPVCRICCSVLGGDGADKLSERHYSVEFLQCTLTEAMAGATPRWVRGSTMARSNQRAIELMFQRLCVEDERRQIDGYQNEYDAELAEQRAETLAGREWATDES